MTDTRDYDDLDLRAAELALGLLDGAERDAARRQAERDPAFARAVVAWEARLAPLAGELAPAAPPPDLWHAIERRIAAASDAANDNQALAAKLRRWRLYGGAMTALAASLAVVVGIGALRETPAAPPAVAEAPNQALVATLASEAIPNSATVAYDRINSSLLVTPGRWPADAAHDHQLWIIPPGGEPVPIGICCERGVERHSIPRDLAPHFRARSIIAVSIEPVGGNRTGQPSSAFAVQGELQPI